MEYPGQALRPPGHGLPRRRSGAWVPRRGRQALDPDSAWQVLRRRGPEAGGLAAGAPYALATSARSNALREFDGGPGQIALQGRAQLTGALGTAASHGCVRLSTSAITWLSRRVGAGTPLTITR